VVERRISSPVPIGNVIVGGSAPVSVQSMTKTDTRDIPTTVAQIAELIESGCEIVRVAVPDMQAAEALSGIKKNCAIPLIADIHFDHRLALAALKAGVDGLRLNPGNIRDKEHITRVVNAAKQRNVPIRIGINAGSLPPATKQYGSVAEHMVDAALEQVRLLESLDFNLIKISLKAFSVLTTIDAYRNIAVKIPYPLHLGITEAGLPRTGAIRSAVGIGILLHEGIGDTIRVSLSGHPCEEVRTAYDILKSLELRQHGPTLVSCPTCGRTEMDTISLAQSVERFLMTVNKPVKVAVMGCVVNGPGEAKDADVGIACGKGKGALFKKGEVIRTVDEKDLLEALLTEIKNIIETG
jgi:(E)-4-hydroxy-3-methylbut-2-enyl-diphosphate synthase